MSRGADRGPVTVLSQDPNDPARKAEYDNLFKVPIGITVAHHEVHEGDSFELCLSAASLAAGDLVISLTTPASPKRMHVVIEVTATEVGQFDVIEGCTIAGGASATPLNKRRDSVKTSSATAVKTGGTPSDGTTIHGPEYFGISGTGSKTGSGGNSSRGVNEWILAPATVYAFRLQGSEASPGTICLEWYEHTDA